MADRLYYLQALDILLIYTDIFEQVSSGATLRSKTIFELTKHSHGVSNDIYNYILSIGLHPSFVKELSDMIYDDDESAYNTTASIITATTHAVLIRWFGTGLGNAKNTMH